MTFKTILKKQIHKINRYRFYKNLKKQIVGNYNYLFLLGTPLHGNIGDQAITVAEYYFFKDYFKEYTIFEIPSIYLQDDAKLFKKIIGNSIIFIHGGGFIGTLWPQEEKMMHNILKTFLNNTIVILPQTIFYESSESGEKLIQKDIKLFSSVKNLTICAREKNSFLLLQNRFNNINSILIPDMVCYFEPLSYQRKRDGVLFCRRNDKEKIILEVEFKELLETINSCNVQNIQYTDTVICQDILPQDRENVVFNKINEFSQYELIITDRLHGMVLAALANTPCIALGNCNYKISGVYEWIKNNQFIKFADSIEIADKFILEILNDKSKYKYDNVSLKAYFNTLSDLIKQEMCGE